MCISSECCHAYFHLWWGKVCYSLWISQYHPASWCSRVHCWLVCLPALSTPLKNHQTETKTEIKPLQNQGKKNLLHLNFSNPVGFVGTFLPALAETPESAPEQQKLFGSQIKSNCCLFHCPDKFFINCVRSLRVRGRGKKKQKAVQECGLGKVPTINGVAVTSGYLKICHCQLPGGFCCL